MAFVFTILIPLVEHAPDLVAVTDLLKRLFCQNTTHLGLWMHGGWPAGKSSTQNPVN